MYVLKYMNNDRLAYDLAKATYGSVQHHENLVNAGYKLDPTLINDRNRVYVGPDNSVLLGYRGTDMFSLGDLSSDYSIVTNRYQDDPQFKEAERFYQMARQKYGNNILVSGHSLGGTKAIHVAKKFHVKNAYAFQPGTGIAKLDTGGAKVFTSWGDPISGRIRGKTFTYGFGHNLGNFEMLRKNY